MSPNSKDSLVFKAPLPTPLKPKNKKKKPTNCMYKFCSKFWAQHTTPGSPAPEPQTTKKPPIASPKFAPNWPTSSSANRSPQNRFINKILRKISFKFPSPSPPPHPQKQNCWSKFGFKLVNFFLLLSKSPQFSLKKHFITKTLWNSYPQFQSPPIVTVVLCCPFLCFRNSFTHRAADTRKHTEREREEGGTDRQTEGRAHTHSESQIHRQTETREEFAFLR